MTLLELVESRQRLREAAVEEHARRIFRDPTTIRRAPNAPKGPKPRYLHRRRSVAPTPPDPIDARAIDEATVALLRATSPPEVLYRVDLAERYGWPAYDEVVRAQPRDLTRFCADPMCGRVFVSHHPDRRYCSLNCRMRAAVRRCWAREHGKRATGEAA